jgi:hypothetical protein
MHLLVLSTSGDPLSFQAGQRKEIYIARFNRLAVECIHDPGSLLSASEVG